MKAPGHAMIVLTGGFLEVGKTEGGGATLLWFSSFVRCS